MSKRKAKAPVFDEAAAIAKARADWLAREVSDFSDVFAQETAKRAIEIAVAGDHRVRIDGDATSIRQIRAAVASLGDGAAAIFDTDRPADFHLVIERTSDIDVTLPPPGEPSSAIAARIALAKSRLPNIGAPDPSAEKLLKDVEARTSRDVQAARRIARTIAALDDARFCSRLHAAEAVSYVGDVDQGGGA